MDFVSGVLGVITADVMEVADVMSFEDLQDAVEVFRLTHLVAASA